LTPFFNQVNLRFLLIFLFLGVTKVSFAQVLIGPTLGVNYSWIKFADKDNRDTFKVAPVAGFHAGAMLSFRVQKRFFLNTSLLYSTKGKRIEGKADKDLVNQAIYKFIEMPISYTAEFKSTIAQNKVFKWYLGIGPNVSYWLGGKGTFYNNDLHENEISKRSYKVTFHKTTPVDNLPKHEMNVENANRWQFGLNLSAGVAFEPWEGYRKFVLTFRYEMGHTNFSKTSRGRFANTVSYQDELRARNQGLRISIAYLIDLKTEQRKKGKSTSTIGKKKRR
jgi:hypothetical protein